MIKIAFTKESRKSFNLNMNSSYKMALNLTIIPNARPHPNWDDMGRYGMIWDGMEWYGMVWAGMGW